MVVGIRGCYGKRTRDSRCFEFDGCVLDRLIRRHRAASIHRPSAQSPALFHQLPACRNSFPLPTPAALTS